MEIYNHIISGAEFLRSPNCDPRPDPDDISLLVVHCISLPPGVFGTKYIDQLFANQLDPEAHAYFQEIHQLRVSAHILICRDGSVRQYVPFNLRAWHAGVSSYQGRERCNDFSIGIELEGDVDSDFTEAQYQTLAVASQTLFAHYPLLSQQAIAGHSDIAPGRKNDPGPFFNWLKFSQLLAG